MWGRREKRKQTRAATAEIYGRRIKRIISKRMCHKGRRRTRGLGTGGLTEWPMDRESAKAIAILGQLPLARELSSTHSTESTSIEMQIQAKLVRNLWLLYSYTEGSYVKTLRYCFVIKSRSAHPTANAKKSDYRKQIWTENHLRRLFITHLSWSEFLVLFWYTNKTS